MVSQKHQFQEKYFDQESTERCTSEATHLHKCTSVPLQPQTETYSKAFSGISFYASSLLGLGSCAHYRTETIGQRLFNMTRWGKYSEPTAQVHIWAVSLHFSEYHMGTEQTKILVLLKSYLIQIVTGLCFSSLVQTVPEQLCPDFVVLHMAIFPP